MNQKDLAVDAPLERVVRPLYAKRDHMAQGKYYVRHIEAMTAEGLHAKSAIAAELAHRDMEIERLCDVLERVSVWMHAAYDRPPQTPECIAMLGQLADALALRPNGQS